MIRKCIFGFVAMATTVAMADSLSTGSGVVVSSNEILTAYHVIDGVDKIEVTIPNVGKCEARFVCGNKAKDWAIVSVNQTLPKCAVIGEIEDVKLGDDVYVLGFPTARVLGKSVKYTSGSISALESPSGEKHIFQISAPIQPGNSGGPLFNKRGQLIGVITASISPEKYYSLTGGSLPQNLNFAVNEVAFRRSPHAVADQIAFERTVDDNAVVTCFFECSLRTAAQESITKKTSIDRVIDTAKPTLKMGEGVKRIDSLFGYQLGNRIDLVGKEVSKREWYLEAKIRKYDADMAEIARRRGLPVNRYDADTIFLGLTKGTKTVFLVRRKFDISTSFRRVDADYSYVVEMARKYVSLFEEKYGIRMMESVLYGDGGYTCLHNAKLQNKTLIRWSYAAKPNFFNDSSQDWISSLLTIDLAGGYWSGWGQDYVFMLTIGLQADTEESDRDFQEYKKALQNERESVHQRELDAL